MDTDLTENQKKTKYLLQGAGIGILSLSFGVMAGNEWKGGFGEKNPKWLPFAAIGVAAILLFGGELIARKISQ